MLDSLQHNYIPEGEEAHWLFLWKSTREADPVSSQCPMPPPLLHRTVTQTWTGPHQFKLCRYTVFSEDRSFQYFTFYEYLSYVFSSYKKDLPDISALIRGFHFEDYTDVLLKDLSTGSRKKVFLITAFALKPELLLLDEPTNGLDYESTEYLYKLISDYKKFGAVLFSSHILESITLTADRVFVLDGGKIQKKFEKEQIKAENIREALRCEHDI